MGHLMRRNILAYKAPPNNEGYDLICIHPDPRHKPKDDEAAQVRVQVKSRYATDCDRGFPVKEASLDAFDFLVVAFLNIGKFYGRNDGTEGEREPEFYTFPMTSSGCITSQFVVAEGRLRNLESEIEPYASGSGFERLPGAGYSETSEAESRTRDSERAEYSHKDRISLGGVSGF